MPSDIPADVAYIGGVWCEAVLYGIHLVAFGVVCSIFLGKSYMRGRDIASGLLLGMSTCMFVLSTVHVALALHHLVRGFILERGIEGGPDGFFHRNVFPARKAIYVVNTLLGDSLLIWRVYVIWGRSWKISTLPVPPTIVANVTFSGHSVFTPNILSWVTSTFVLNITTQITTTVMLAAKIFRASNLSSAGSRNRSYYTSLLWLVVESGAIYTSAAIVQLITYLAKMNAGVMLELMLAQLSAIVPALIVVRVGLGFAYEGNEPRSDEVVLTTFQDSVHISVDNEKGISDTIGSSTFTDKALSEGQSSQSTRFRGQCNDTRHQGHHMDPGGLV